MEPAIIERLRDNLERVRARISACSQSLDPNLPKARLVAVTKSVEPSVGAELARLLESPEQPAQLAENRLEGLTQKVDYFREHAPLVRVNWHFVGRIQRNKARRIAVLADELHGVDSLNLLETLERVCLEEGRKPRIYLQLKLADDPGKGGLELDAFGEVFAAARECRALDLAGLMTLPPVAEDSSATLALAERCFRQLADLSATLPSEAFATGSPQLSMGMSADLEVALAAGSHWLRIGRALFEGLPEHLRVGRPAPQAGPAPSEPNAHDASPSPPNAAPGIDHPRG